MLQSNFRSFSARKINISLKNFNEKDSNFCDSNNNTLFQVLIVNPEDKNIAESIRIIDQQKVHNLKIFYDKRVKETIWSLHRNNLQLDSTVLEEMFLSGKTKLSDIETAAIWQNTINERIESIEQLENLKPTTATTIEQTTNAKTTYDEELSVAKSIVRKASFISRSLQYALLKPTSTTTSTSTNENTINKKDESPVTIVDFAMQAIIIDTLHTSFPDDCFVAEEDSQLLRKDSKICEKVLSIVEDATSKKWSKEKLFEVLDLGLFENNINSNNDDDDDVEYNVNNNIANIEDYNNNENSKKIKNKKNKKRVWILDPIDGTKGFFIFYFFNFYLLIVISIVNTLLLYFLLCTFFVFDFYLFFLLN
jgi:3'-phosphoadenosine 5'-phosphosulfate (PAPS) 3'-phosphatase